MIRVSAMTASVMMMLGTAPVPPSPAEQPAQADSDAPRPNQVVASELSISEALARANEINTNGNPGRAAEIMREALGNAEASREADLARIDEARWWIEAERWAEALEALRAVDLNGAQPGDRAVARFLVGQALYREVLVEIAADEAVQAPPNAEAMFERAGRLRRAANAFRSVLDVEPNDAAAARNVERVRRLVADLEDQALQEAQRQQQREQLQQQLEELAQEQQNNAEQTERSQGDDEQELQDQQQQTSERTEDAQEQAQQAGASQEAQDAMERAREQQARAEDALERGDLDEAEQAQRQAAQELREAAESLSQQGEQGEESGEGEGEESDEQSENASDEAEGESRNELAEALLERERRQREQRDRVRRAMQGTPVVVERDW